MKKTLLIDADSLCFVNTIDEKEAIEILENKISKIKRMLPEYELNFFLTIGSCFRYKILPTYKANRTGERPTTVKILKDYLINKYDAKYNTSLESDDMVCDIYRSDPNNHMIASIDKDVLYNISGIHLNLYNMTKVNVTDEQCHYNFYKQIIVGDPTDNIKSLCKGIGDVKLENIIKDSEMKIEDVAQYICNRMNVCFKQRYRLIYCGELDVNRIEIKQYDKNDSIEYYIERYVFKNKDIKNPKEVNKVNSSFKKRIKKYNNKYQSENSIIRFGKHKGITFKNLYEDFNGYFMWLYNTTEDLDLKYLLKSILMKNKILK